LTSEKLDLQQIIYQLPVNLYQQKLLSNLLCFRLYFLAYQTNISGVVTVLEKSVFTCGYRPTAHAIWCGTTFFCDKGQLFY